MHLSPSKTSIPYKTGANPWQGYGDVCQHQPSECSRRTHLCALSEQVTKEDGMVDTQVLPVEVMQSLSKNKLKCASINIRSVTVVTSLLFCHCK